MELFHIHLLGNSDSLYDENKEIIIGENYNNNIYYRTMESNAGVKTEDFPYATGILNYINKMEGYSEIGLKSNLSVILSALENNPDKDEEIKALKLAKYIIHNLSFSIRELALEDYRKKYAIDKPSRMHSLFACDQLSFRYWIKSLVTSPADVYRIEALDEPFLTNEQLLPKDTFNYTESFNAAGRYFNPSNLNGISDEYLIQGKVKLLEKVAEFR